MVKYFIMFHDTLNIVGENMGKRRYKATINGKNYILIGDYTQEHFETATAIAQEQLDQIQRLAPTLDEEQAAILLAINTISTQIKLEKEMMHLRSRLAKLEYELSDLKNPERVLQRGLHEKKMQETSSAEQLSIEEFTNGINTKVSFENANYKPAIFNKGD